jgi:hypothetical protein
MFVIQLSFYLSSEFYAVGMVIRACINFHVICGLFGNAWVICFNLTYALQDMLVNYMIITLLFFRKYVQKVHLCNTNVYSAPQLLDRKVLVICSVHLYVQVLAHVYTYILKQFMYNYHFILSSVLWSKFAHFMPFLWYVSSKGDKCWKINLKTLRTPKGSLPPQNTITRGTNP